MSCKRGLLFGAIDLENKCLKNIAIDLEKKCLKNSTWPEGRENV
jgi:hypothetical protein